MKYPKRSQYKHAKQKKYHVSNWAEYNEGLRRRGDLTVWFDEEAIANWKADKSGKPGGQRVYSEMAIETVSLIIIDPAGMVPLVALRRRKKPESARGGTCRDHAINGPRSWTTQSRWTPAIDAQRLNWLRRRRAIRSGGGAHPLAATRRTFAVGDGRGVTGLEFGVSFVETQVATVLVVVADVCRLPDYAA